MNGNCDRTYNCIPSTAGKKLLVKKACFHMQQMGCKTLTCAVISV